MQIEWFEILAQVFNFFILLLILRKIFYKPVNQVMESRQQKIDQLLGEAEEKMANANSLMDEYQAKLARLESEEEATIREARKKAEDMKEDLLEKYKKEADRRREEFLREIEDDKNRLSREIQTSLGQNSVKIARQILSYITDQDLEEEYFESFLNKIDKLEEAASDFEISFQEEKFEFVSADEISKEKKATLEAALKEKFKNFKELRYSVDEDLVMGYELRLESYVLNSSLKKYLEQTEINILKTIEAKN
ncbi:F0F1 ATP synthase subunit delta [Gudongella sp. SC589]|uniref:F0F1 ATP synthase subunit delta n=1 Tax=Gudongella sp. SC589 TaxID=3385990 RepID=UPI003904D84C